MRTQQLIPLVALILWSSPVSSWGLFKRAAVVITKPNSGDTIVAKADFDIEWTHSTENNVTISLRQGTTTNMTLVHVIAASTPNNGSYAWRSRDDNYLYGGYSDRPDSNCNYALEFRTGGEIINSDFFTIINERDGGINANTTCAGGKIEDGGSQQIGPSKSNNTNGGVSAGALGGAVAGVAVGILAIVGGFFFLAKRQGWVMTRAECEQLIEGKLRNEGAYLNKSMDKGVAQVDGGQIFQMP
ncbi:hypothetical protein F5882DRAFT_407604 [Hyaloscypha sp. PMI_1271]|nr:hypothetical protein F5882DRAFT_407604 [Hyaloscypha sp. PMI_1271]